MLSDFSTSICEVKSLSRVRLFVTPWMQPTRLLSPWNFPGKSTAVGCHFLLQEIFLTQGLNPGLPHCRQTLYPLNHKLDIHEKKNHCIAGHLRDPSMCVPHWNREEAVE